MIFIKVIEMLNILTLAMAYMLKPPPPPIKLRPVGDWNGKDIVVLTHMEAQVIIDLWHSANEINNTDMEKMHIAVSRMNSNDIFLGYSPFVKSRNELQYVFRCRLHRDFGVETLQVCSGVACPYIKNIKPSIVFKELLPLAVVGIIVDFQPIMKNMRFKLAWERDHP